MKRHLNIEMQTRNMKFDTEEDCRGIYRFLGDEQLIADKFPLFYSALQKARSAPEEDGEATGYINWLTLYSVLYDPEAKQLEVNFNITLKQPGAQLFAYVYNADTSLFESIFYDETQSADTSCIFDNVEMAEGESMDLFVECPFVEGNDTVLRGLLAPIRAIYTEEDIIESITADDPNLKKNTKPPVKVVYGRTLGYGEVADYDFAESRAESGNQRFFLSVGGSATLKAGHTVKEICGQQACVMTGGQFGTIKYKNKTGMRVYTNESKNMVTWAFDPDWNDEIQDSVKFGQREYIFDLSIICKCIEMPESKNTFRIHVTSYDKEAILPEKIVPRIMLKWGCIGKDSLILMADGTKRPVSEIRCGDWVATSRGMGNQGDVSCGVTRVEDVLRGTEETLYRVVTECGLTVEGTLMHPILTDQGFIPIRDVNGTTRVVTAEGIQAVRYCYLVEYNDMVYGLELEDGGAGYFAGGIAVGTNEMQGKMFSVPQYAESEQCPAFRAEQKQMEAHVKNRGMTNGSSVTHRY